MQPMVIAGLRRPTDLIPQRENDSLYIGYRAFFHIYQDKGSCKYAQLIMTYRIEWKNFPERIRRTRVVSKRHIGQIQCPLRHLYGITKGFFKLNIFTSLRRHLRNSMKYLSLERYRTQIQKHLWWDEFPLSCGNAVVMRNAVLGAWIIAQGVQL